MAREKSGRGRKHEVVVYGPRMLIGVLICLNVGGFKTAGGGVNKYWIPSTRANIYSGNQLKGQVYWNPLESMESVGIHGVYGDPWSLRGSMESIGPSAHSSKWGSLVWRIRRHMVAVRVAAANPHSLRCRGAVGLVTCLGRPTHPLPAASRLINTEQRTVMLTNQPARGDPLHIPPSPPPTTTPFFIPQVPTRLSKPNHIPSPAATYLIPTTLDTHPPWPNARPGITRWPSSPNRPAKTIPSYGTARTMAGRMGGWAG